MRIQEIVRVIQHCKSLSYRLCRDKRFNQLVETLMALPVALAAAGRYAGQAVVNAAPAIKDRAMKYISQATNGRISDASQVANFAASGKNAFAIVASGGVKAGLSVNDVMQSAITDKDLLALRQNLETEFATVYARIDAAESHFMSATQQQTAQDLMAMDIFKFMRQAKLGGTIREAHVKLRMFLAMSEDEISRGMALGWDRQ